MRRPFFRLYAPDGDGGGGGSGGGAQGGSGGQGAQGAAVSGQRDLTGGAGAAAAGGGQAQGGSQQQGGQGQANGGAVAETFWKGYFKEDGTLDRSRLEHLPAELKDSKAIFERYGKVDDLFKAFAHQARLAREKGLMPLREGATETEQKEYFAKLASVTGAPAKPEEYGLKAEDPELQAEYDAFAQVFHKHAIAPAAVKELFALNEARTKALTEKMETERAKQEDEHFAAQEKLLRDAFGPLKDQKIKEAIAGARWLGIDTNSPLFTQNAAVIIAAAKVASKIEEARFVDGGSAGQQTMSAEAEIKAMASDPNHKYYAALRDPMKNPALHREAIAHRRKLAERMAAENLARHTGR